jgi:hypothetical protein
MFAVQDDVVAQIVSALPLELTDDLDAYQSAKRAGGTFIVSPKRTTSERGPCLSKL